MFILLQLLVAASQGFAIRDVGWGNWGLRRNKDFSKSYHDFVVLDASAWVWTRPDHPSHTTISAMSKWESFIKTESYIYQERTWPSAPRTSYRSMTRRSFLCLMTTCR